MNIPSITDKMAIFAGKQNGRFHMINERSLLAWQMKDLFYNDMKMVCFTKV